MNYLIVVILALGATILGVAIEHLLHDLESRSK
jgi:hypothetical protein